MFCSTLQDVTNTSGTIVWFRGNECQDENKAKCPPRVAVEYLEPGLEMGENYGDVFADVANHNMAAHTYLHVNEQPTTLAADVSGGGSAWPNHEEVHEPLAVMACDITVDTLGLLEIRNEYFLTTCVSKKSIAQKLGKNASNILRIIEDFLYDPKHEYTVDILAHMLLDEARNMPNPDYMQMQPHINPCMRTILVRWLFNVHVVWKLRKETWFLAVNLIDQYLSRHVVKPHRLPLIGVTASCIASKFEEIKPPALRHWVHILDCCFTVNDIAQMECSMFESLGGNVVKPTTTHFLQIFLDFFVNADTMQCKFAHYIITLASLELGMIKYPPSCIAAAAISLSKQLIWHVPFRSSTNELMLQCLQELRALVKVAQPSRNMT